MPSPHFFSSTMLIRQLPVLRSSPMPSLSPILEARASPISSILRLSTSLRQAPSPELLASPQAAPSLSPVSVQPVSSPTHQVVSWGLPSPYRLPMEVPTPPPSDQPDQFHTQQAQPTPSRLSVPRVRLSFQAVPPPRLGLLPQPDRFFSLALEVFSSRIMHLSSSMIPPTDSVSGQSLRPRCSTSTAHPMLSDSPMTPPTTIHSPRPATDRKSV